MTGESKGLLCRKPWQKSTSRKGAESNVLCQGTYRTFSGRCSWDPKIRGKRDKEKAHRPSNGTREMLPCDIVSE